MLRRAKVSIVVVLLVAVTRMLLPAIVISSVVVASLFWIPLSIAVACWLLVILLALLVLLPHLGVVRIPHGLK